MARVKASDFFKEKRPWSIRKDRILASYMAPYLQAAKKIGKPILVVDGFAGPGKFKDGSPGSPLLLAQAIKKSNAPARLLAAESNAELSSQLQEILEPFHFAEVKPNAFGDVVDEVVSKAPTHTIFMYLDPFAITGLSFKRVQEILSYVKRGTSVEVLINCNAVAFVRASHAVLKCTEAPDAPTDEPYVHATKDTLDSFAGGDWWESSLTASTFSDQVSQFIAGYAARTSEHFSEVCVHELKARYHHPHPKYALVHGSRHPHALRLMNDEMAKSLKTLADQEAPTEDTLFEIRPESLVPDPSTLQPILVGAAREPQSRLKLIELAMRARFGEFTKAEIRGQIELLLKRGTLKSETGSTRTNDKTIIRSS